MNKCDKFIEFFERLIDETNAEMTDEVREFYEMLKVSTSNYGNKPALTETGLLILEYLQKSEQTSSLKARDIAEGLGVHSRKVSGAMRKLVDDGYIDKFGQNPVIYTLTEKGKNFNLDEYKENMNNA